MALKMTLAMTLYFKMNLMNITELVKNPSSLRSENISTEDMRLWPLTLLVTYWNKMMALPFGC